jgi:2-polyprenyl-3-methyl-5-hydroxy-6-metoxy-1,4-benzoquinol methylase
LDYGAGTAHISRTFKQVLANKVNIYCLELNPACKDLYKKYGLFQISTLKEIEKKIDFIYMIEVIEHLENPIESMKQLRKILNLNALIFLSTPLGTIKENQTHAYETSSHLHFFSRKSFNLMLKKSGFAEIKFKYYSEMYPIPSNNYQRLKMAVKGFINNSFLEYFSKNKHITGYTKLTNI